jgi:hypothetical protein
MPSRRARRTYIGLVGLAVAAALSAAAPAHAGFAVGPGSPVAAGTLPIQTAIGDYNSDGVPDMAVANASSQNVSVLVGDGSGGFSAAGGSPVALGLTPTGIATADFNADGRLDLAAVGSISGSTGQAAVLLGNGSGGFAQATGSPFAPGVLGRSVAADDLNGDGRIDLLVGGSGNATALLGNGSGGFTPAAGSPFTVGGGNASVAIGYINGDRRLDAAVANAVGDNVSVLLGNGSGGFTPAPGSPVAVGDAPTSVATGDLDADGRSDLVVANSGSNNVSVLLGNGSGRFSAPRAPIAMSQPEAVAIADFNLDGKPDLAIGRDNRQKASVLNGDGSGGFTFHSVPASEGEGAFAIAAADMDLDGRTDLITTNVTTNNVMVMLNTSAPILSPSNPELTFPSQPQNTIGPSRTLVIVNRGDAPLHIATAEIFGAGGDDFVRVSDDCTRATVPAGSSCVLVLRFAPSGTGARAATLRLTSNAPLSDVALSGDGAPPPTTGPGPAGADGSQGPAGQDGAPGADGATGPTGPQGAPGRDARVTCKVAKPKKGKKVKVTCKVVLSAPAGAKVSARLMRGGRVYARATGTGSLRLRAVRRLTRGRYTLRLRVDGDLTKQTVIVK